MVIFSPTKLEVENVGMTSFAASGQANPKCTSRSHLSAAGLTFPLPSARRLGEHYPNFSDLGNNGFCFI